MKIVLVCLVILAGCTAGATRSNIDSGCPPGQTRIEDENTGTYDCASRQDMEDIGEVLDEHRGRH